MLPLPQNAFQNLENDDSLADIDEIVPSQLYLSSLYASQSSTILKTHGITHVLSVCEARWMSPPPLDDISDKTHKVVDVLDLGSTDLLIHLPGVCDFIQRALDEGGKVLVHCQMGMSRSATCVIAFLMKTRKWDYPEAYQFVKQRRSIVNPNFGFKKQLHVFAECNYQPTEDHPSYRSWKEDRSELIELRKRLNMYIE